MRDRNAYENSSVWNMVSEIKQDEYIKLFVSRNAELSDVSFGGHREKKKYKLLLCV